MSLRFPLLLSLSLFVASCASGPLPAPGEKPPVPTPAPPRAEDVNTAPPVQEVSNSAPAPGATPPVAVGAPALPPPPPPPTPEELFAKAEASYKAGSLHEALAHLDSVRSAKADFPGLDLLEARVRYAARDPGAGLTLLETLLSRREGEEELPHAYARWAKETGRGKEARAFLTRLADAGDPALPFDAQVMAAAGWSAFEAGDFSEARRHWSRIRDREACRPYLLFLARVEFLLGYPAEAAALARQARSADPAEAGMILADVDRVEGRAAAAKAGYEEVLSASPGHYAATVNLGFLLLGQGDAKAAADLFSKAVGKAPANPEALNGLGLARRALGDFKGAREAYEKALAASPGHLPTLKNFGILLEKYLGDPAGGILQYETYVRLKGGDEEAERWIKAARRLMEERK